VQPIPRLQSNELSEHVQSRVELSELETHPHPHIVIDNFLPNGLYQQILETWPQWDDFRFPFSEKIGVIDFSLDGSLSSCSVPEPIARLRTAIFYCAMPLIAPYFLPFLGLYFDSFYEDGRAAPANIKSSDLFVSRDFIIERKEQSVLNAHIDDIRNLFTLIFYCAENSDRPDLGTMLYRQTSEAGATLDYYQESRYQRGAQFAGHVGVKCEFEKLVPFTPNKLFVMLGGLHPWHGQILDDHGFSRKTYNAFITLERERMEKLLPRWMVRYTFGDD